MVFVVETAKPEWAGRAVRLSIPASPFNFSVVLSSDFAFRLYLLHCRRPPLRNGCLMYI